MTLCSYMLFRDKKGELTELLRHNFTSDTDYYMAIMATREMPNIAKTISEKDRILDIIKKKR